MSITHLDARSENAKFKAPLLISIIAAIAAIASATVTFAIWQEETETNKRELRAYVSTDSREVFPEPTTGSGVGKVYIDPQISITNFGRTPAYNLRLWANNYAITCSAFRSESKLRIEEMRARNRPPRWANIYLAPGDIKELRVANANRNEKIFRNAYSRSGLNCLTVVGWVEFDDVFRERQRFYFVHIYQNPSAVPAQVEHYLDHNDLREAKNN